MALRVEGYAVAEQHFKLRTFVTLVSAEPS